jgi:hypothetical protein
MPKKRARPPSSAGDTSRVEELWPKLTHKLPPKQPQSSMPAKLKRVETERQFANAVTLAKSPVMPVVVVRHCCLSRP